MVKKERGRNELCACGSGLKYKLCHGDNAKRLQINEAAKRMYAVLIVKEQVKHNICPKCKGELKELVCKECGSDFNMKENSNAKN